MESLQVIDINYQYIYENGEKNDEIFVIPDISRKTLSYDTISDLLTNDDVEIQKMSQIKYYNEYKCEYYPLKTLDLSKINPFQQKLKLLLYVGGSSNQTVDSNESKITSSSSPNLLGLASNNLSSTFLMDRESDPDEPQLDLIYMYGNPLLQTIKKDNNYDIENNDSNNEIENIYNLMKKTGLEFKAEFNPIEEDYFINSFKKAPKILHIFSNLTIENVNGIKKSFLFLESEGKIEKINEDEIKVYIQLESKSRDIELVIISAPYSNQLGKCFNDAGIENVICINNEIKYPNQNQTSDNFIKFLYTSLLEGNTIMSAFLSAKSKIFIRDANLCSIYGSGKKIIFDTTNRKHGKFSTNSNCVMNCKFEKDSKVRIIGRNKEMYKLFLLLTLHDSRVLVVWGMEGVGKKIMVQKVGKYLFERKYFTEVKYIEQGSVISEEEIKAQINEKDINTGNPNNSLNKILIIVTFDTMNQNEKTVNSIEEIFIELIKKYRNYYFLVCLTFPSFDSNYEPHFKLPQINLNKLSVKSSINLFTMLLNLLPNKVHLIKSKIEEVVKSSNGFPSEIYLRAGYVSMVGEKISSSSLKTVDIIHEMMNLENKQRILLLFTILKKGISKTELYLLIGIENLKKNRDLIINKYHSKILNEYMYEIDNSFTKHILLYVNQKVISKLLFNILKIYSGILRNCLLNNKNPDELNEEINKGIWLSFHQDVFYEYYNPIFREKKFIFLPHHESNLKNIFTNYLLQIKTLFDINNNIISNNSSNNNPSNISNNITVNEEHKDIKQLSEFFEQISICFPTLLFISNKYKQSCEMVNVFIDLSKELSLKHNEIRLLVFKYCITNDTSIIKIIEKSIDEKGKLEKLNLIALMDYQRGNGPPNQLNFPQINI